MLQLQSWGIPGNAPTALPKKLEHSRECLNLYSAAEAIQCIKELYRRPSQKVGAFANAPTSELEHSRECSNCSPKIVGAFPGMLLRMPELGHSRMPKLFWESLLVMTQTEDRLQAYPSAMHRQRIYCKPCPFTLVSYLARFANLALYP